MSSCWNPPGGTLKDIGDGMSSHLRLPGRVEHWRGDPKEAPCLCLAFPPSCPVRRFRNPVSSARRIARSMRISRTTRSCTLLVNVYEA
jgi:hypothetical protein